MDASVRYTVQEAGRLVGLSQSQIRAYARAGRLGARLGPGRAWSFEFQDLVLLRAAKALASARIPHRKIVRAIDRVRRQVPAGSPLSAVQFDVVGNQILARSSGALWSPDSGQARFDFSPAPPDGHSGVARRGTFGAMTPDAPELGAEEWFEVGLELETLAPEEAREAFRRTLELAPLHSRAHVCLARILRELGELHAAEQHCRVAVEEDPDEPAAFVELGLSLRAAGRDAQASDALRMAVRLDTRAPEAYDALVAIAEAANDPVAVQRWREARRRMLCEAEDPSTDEPA